jgi:phosphoserine phosphatase RsbU/P
MLHKLSIRWKLSLFVLLGSGLILAAVIGYNYSYAHEMLRKSLEEKAWQLAHATANRIETEAYAVMKVVEGMGLALSIAPPQSQEQVRHLLAGSVNSSDEIIGACLAFNRNSQWPEKTGCLTPYAWRTEKGIQYTDISENGVVHDILDWYFLPAELKRPVWSEPYFDEGGADMLMVTYSAPVYEKETDAFMGVITSDVSLEGLSGVLDSLPLGQSGYAFLVSKNGTFIAHPDKNLILRENIFSLAETNNDPDLRNLGIRMKRGGSGFIPFTSLITGEACWMVYVPVPSTGWTLAALFPQDELLEQINALSRNQFSIGAACFLILFLVVLLIAGSIARPIQQLDRAANTLAAGNLEAALPVIPGRDEVARLGRSFSKMRDDLIVYMNQLTETVAAKERIESELRVAHDIQMSLVPRTFPPFPDRDDIDLFALMEPAREVGGDFYDFFMPDDAHICLVMGDVSGKGVPAALFMAVTRSFLRSLASAEDSPALTLQRLNDEIAADNDACMFVTLFYCSIHLPTGGCRYANGGHNPPFLIREGEAPAELPRVQGTAIGALEGIEFEEGTFSFNPGDQLFLYTDGVTEAQNTADELFGEDRTAGALAELRDGTSRDMLGEIRARIAAFAGDAEQFDDITMLLFRWISSQNT